MRYQALVIAFIAALAIGGDALSFGTLNSFGQNAEHEHITRAALSDFGPHTLDELAGRRGSYGAVGAPDNPLRGLLLSSEAHCDNGDYYAADAAGSATNYAQSRAEAEEALTRCRAWIAARLEDAVRAAEPLAHPGWLNSSLDCVFNGQPGRAKCTVLEDLGLAFHAAQDFYAHSNWVDRPADGAISLENPPGLGNDGRAAWLDPRGDAPFPQGLISGCFESVPERLFCSGRVRHQTLDKDTGSIGDDGAAGPGTTPRGAVHDNFRRAVAAAIEDTRDKWAFFRERVYAVYGQTRAARIVCVVQNDDYRRCR
jgi:hypothetical protein